MHSPLFDVLVFAQCLPKQSFQVLLFSFLSLSPLPLTNTHIHTHTDVSLTMKPGHLLPFLQPDTNCSLLLSVAFSSVSPLTCNQGAMRSELWLWAVGLHGSGQWSLWCRAIHHFPHLLALEYWAKQTPSRHPQGQSPGNCRPHRIRRPTARARRTLTAAQQSQHFSCLFQTKSVQLLFTEHEPFHVPLLSPGTPYL